ncbi:MAG TPA: hypothetical protein VK689_11190 [Armatimonadota bacterium]|nr:hypothetical protein [Armatimonadota bacterium]
MEEPHPHRSARIRPTEYIAPALAILLVLLGAWWFFARLMERSRVPAPQPAPPTWEQKLRLNAPRDAR